MLGANRINGTKSSTRIEVSTELVTDREELFRIYRIRGRNSRTYRMSGCPTELIAHTGGGGGEERYIGG